MPRHPLPSPLSLLQSAWRFYRKQSVLTSVWIWLLLLPLFANTLISHEMNPVEGEYIWDKEWIAPSVLALLILGVLILWGEACILLVGKRMLQHKAGRTRTSLRAVCRQARKYIVPLILTSILRACYTLLWSLLLVIPGIIYTLRTIFFAIVVVAEGKAYRPALHSSIAMMRKRTMRVLLRLIGTAILVFVIPIAIDLLLNQSATASMMPLATAVALVHAAVWSFASLLYTLSLVALYAYLKEHTQVFEEYKPEKIEKE